MSAKDELAGAVLDHLLGDEGRDGLDGSLRALAGAIGVGHSLLLYHFGSREGLLAAVHEQCERRERAHLAAFRAQGGDPVSTMRRMWRHLAEPRMWPLYRLGFALRSRRPGVDGTREPWIAELLPLVGAVGVPADRARAEAMLWLGTSRGLLWELATGADPSEVDAAAEVFFALRLTPGRPAARGAAAAGNRRTPAAAGKAGAPRDVPLSPRQRRGVVRVPAVAPIRQRQKRAKGVKRAAEPAGVRRAGAGLTARPGSRAGGRIPRSGGRSPATRGASGRSRTRPAGRAGRAPWTR